MCGICGYVGAGKPAVLEAMSKALVHRGPDGHGVFHAEGVGLAHRRLAIIDLAGGQQPMFSPRGDVVVFNGEIYNFQEVRRELESLGQKFVSQSDTEVLLLAYLQWGERCLEKFRGMFAFALWDVVDQSLFIARDRVGIKPLYYAELGGVFYFASESKALLEIPGFSRRLNHRALPLYLSFRYTPGEQTLFEGVDKLLPGHAMRIRPGQSPRIHRYWSLAFEPDEGPSEAQWRERFWGVFEESVRLRMISDVPLGAYLSGGLDSSLIVAAMSGLSNRPVETFSVGFRDAKFNELPYAQEVAERFACRHHILHAEDEAADLLDQVVYHLDEPLGDLAAIPTFLMARETKPHVTVALSGEGADELLAGYPKYRAYLLNRKLSALLPSSAWEAAASWPRQIVLQRVLGAMANPDRTRSYLELAAVFSPGEQASLLLGAKDLAAINGSAEFIAPFFRQPDEPLSQLLALDFHSWLPDDLLLKNDKMTMAHGVEARVPYLDHKLVELCARIPARFKLRWHQDKVLLRQVMVGRLPERIRRRKKTGFTVPLGQWYKGKLGRRIDQVFSPDFIRQQGLFRKDFLTGLQQRPLDHPYYRRQFWTIAALGLWQQRFGVQTD